MQSDGIRVGGGAGTVGSVTVGSFSGGIVNSTGATISAGADGVVVGGDANTGGSVTVSNFSGGIVNHGAIDAGNNGIVVGGQATVLYFSDGITNTGTISVTGFGEGILVDGNPFPLGISSPGSPSGQVSEFTGGITNTGTIHTAGTGIAVGGYANGTGLSASVSTFSGGITNAGTISVGNDGIVVGGNAGDGGSVTVSSFSSGDIVNSAGGKIGAGRTGILVGGIANNGGMLTVATFTGDIINAGSISAGSEGGNGVFVGGYALTLGSVAVSNFDGGITNLGTITADSGSGVVVGTFGGQHVQTFTGNISNNGTITAKNFAIEVTNADVQGAIINTGDLTASLGIAIDVSGVAAGITIDQDSGTVSGAIDLSAHNDTLNVSGGVIDGNINGAGLDTVDFDLSSSFTYSNSIDDVSKIEVTAGTLKVAAGGFVNDAQVDDTATFAVLSGASVSGTTVSSGGEQIVDSGGTASNTVIDGGIMEVVSGGSAGSSVTFESGGILQIDGPNAPGSTLLDGTTVEGFATGVTIDLSGIEYNSTSHNATVNGGDQLVVTEGGQNYYLQLTGDYIGDIFNLVARQPQPRRRHRRNNSMLSAWHADPDRARSRGASRSSNRRRGHDQSGALRPINWVGRRNYSGRSVMGRTDILPVCIKAGALEDNVPKRDLWISPNHAMYLDGLLIEAKDLINGRSIVRAKKVDSVEYFHLELVSHDVIIAEGAPSESFIDDDSRGMFHNAHEYGALYPEAATSAGTVLRAASGGRL